MQFKYCSPKRTLKIILPTQSDGNVEQYVILVPNRCRISQPLKAKSLLKFGISHAVEPRFQRPGNEVDLFHISAQEV